MNSREHGVSNYIKPPIEGNTSIYGSSKPKIQFPGMGASVTNPGMLGDYGGYGRHR
eukprot:CAMPEP_0205826904 /NCGR_PEP_ID=MMETSP0206-20130828/30211_1 /ASSEMBLY_ACC=CAM_ASM_000279 /TAXON_ID=36767 /ORGANISM="Euplotes focardii, Strain TN1" /LENGTH=55 /DNA_ID=CAMNT_0053127247 /DNA_START=309 /DNA_END=473 /DNA_ORIENTATION=-